MISILFPPFFLGSPVLFSVIDLPVLLLMVITIVVVSQDNNWYQKVELIKSELLVIFSILGALLFLAFFSSLINQGEFSTYLTRPIRIILIVFFLSLLIIYMKLEKIFIGVLFFSLINLSLVFYQRPNKGLCATLNEALEWCEGEYLSCIASDAYYAA